RGQASSSQPASDQPSWNHQTITQPAPCAAMGPRTQSTEEYLQMSVQSGVRSFPNPYEVEPPAGCEGYEEMYPYYMRFSEERRVADEARCWFFDGMHFPEPMFPFDTVTADSPFMSLGQINSRIFVVPPAL